MADPKVRYRFVSRHVDQPVQEVSLKNALTGEQVVVKFQDGAFETTDPGLIPELLILASYEGHPFKREAIAPKAAEKKGS